MTVATPGERAQTKGARKIREAEGALAVEPGLSLEPRDDALAAVVDNPGVIETKEHVAGKTFQLGEGVTVRPMGTEGPTKPHTLSVAAGCVTPQRCRFVRTANNPDGTKDFTCEVCNAGVKSFL